MMSSNRSTIHGCCASEAAGFVHEPKHATDVVISEINVSVFICVRIEFDAKDSASRAQKQTKFAVLPRRRLSGRGFGLLEAPCGCRGHPNGGRDTNAPVPLGTSWGAGIRLLSLVVSSVPVRRCAARRLFLRIFRFLFALLKKRVTFALG